LALVADRGVEAVEAVGQSVFPGDDPLSMRPRDVQPTRVGFYCARQQLGEFAS
jgi:hypothetical protein